LTFTMRRTRGFWPQTIVTAYRAYGNQARHEQIYGWISSHVALTTHELSPQPSANGRPHYVNTVRGIINDMVRAGRLVYIADGHYKLAV
jgi:hypothetical protein